MKSKKFVRTGQGFFISMCNFKQITSLYNCTEEGEKKKQIIRKINNS